jgi:hypothetical protein
MTDLLGHFREYGYAIVPSIERDPDEPWAFVHELVGSGLKWWSGSRSGRSRARSRSPERSVHAVSHRQPGLLRRAARPPGHGAPRRSAALGVDASVTVEVGQQTVTYDLTAGSGAR